MLRLIQIISYMMNHVEYTESEVIEIFESIERCEMEYHDLLDMLNIDTSGVALDFAAIEKLPKWRSALQFVKLKAA